MGVEDGVGGTIDDFASSFFHFVIWSVVYISANGTFRVVSQLRLFSRDKPDRYVNQTATFMGTGYLLRLQP